MVSRSGQAEHLSNVSYEVEADRIGQKTVPTSNSICLLTGEKEKLNLSNFPTLPVVGNWMG